MPNDCDDHSAALSKVIQNYWGYDSFLPLQQRAMNCVLGGRDSIVVLPTGGGKSLCFQAPAMCTGGLAVVVSPLISLMKDQVDALRTCGVPAAYVNSTVSYNERRRVANAVRDESLKLLYMAPERLVLEPTIDFLKKSNVSFVAIDEAHCISEWGHDFRPEYHELRMLKDAFPNIGIHAYTATATETVQSDIARQLGLIHPEILVGSCDRPNLMYKVEIRNDRIRQIRAVMDRHRGESGIIYCIRRADVDETSAVLAEQGYRVLPYHAGLTNDNRRQNQEAFIEEKIEAIVATVAFGMGIDKSNVRYVVHAGMPKSLENYQQESGRAGRDGLEAECCLLYSGGDFGLWKKMLNAPDSDARPGALESLSAIYQFCTGVTCRHRALARYFGQELDGESCNACDVCLGNLDLVDDPLTVGQKILSCVVRLRQHFGGEYTAMVLSGSQDQRIVAQKHDQLSTWGILSDEGRRNVRDWIEQLVGQNYLEKVGEYNVLNVTPEGRQLLRGEAKPRLLKPKKTSKKQRDGQPAAGVAADSWEGVDRGLFEALRELRHENAAARQVPAYIVFGDAALRDMARRRPSTREGFLEVKGVGVKKCEDYGEVFVQCIADHCREHQLSMDVEPEPATSSREVRRKQTGPSSSEQQAFELFKQGCSVQQASETMNRATSTTYGYLAQYVRLAKICDPADWVNEATSRKIQQATEHVGLQPLQPIFEFLEETVDYHEIRIVIECLKNTAAQTSNDE
jgi:ATP-dependent DNA helicase RecQ